MIINSELAILSAWFKANNRLSQNIQKNYFVMFGYKRVPAVKDYKISVILLKLIEKKFLKWNIQFFGVITDYKFIWQRHIDFVAEKLSKALSVLSRLKYKLQKSCVFLYYCLVYPHFNYCNTIW